ncbi:MAG: NAD(P)H-dependent oxidoreductase subunit E [Solirubrobacteraceae bacterium]
MTIQVRRYEHGSRVPGWDEAVDLTKDPSPVPDPATTPVPEELRAEIEAAMAKYPDRRSAAIPALAAVQRRYGWCTPEGIEQAASVMRLTPAYLTAVATFYDMLETRPVGRQTIYVCTNISCSLRGARELAVALSRATGAPVNGSSADGVFRLCSFECLGACDIAPMASIEGHYRGPLSESDAIAIAEHLRAGKPAREVLPERSYEGDYARRLAERQRAESEGGSSR